MPELKEKNQQNRREFTNGPQYMWKFSILQEYTFRSVEKEQTVD